MKTVLRAEGADGLTPAEEEPTPRVGPCLDEWGLVDEETAATLYGMLEPVEQNYADLLLESGGDLQVYIRVFIGLDCLHVVEVRVRGCLEQAEKVRRMFEMPEFTRMSLEGECAEVVAPADIRERVASALEKVGVRLPGRVVAYRLVNRLVPDEA